MILFCPLGTNLCGINNKNGGCQELCFYRNDDQVKCACSFGKLDTDGKSCVGRYYNTNFDDPYYNVENWPEFHNQSSVL